MPHDADDVSLRLAVLKEYASGSDVANCDVDTTVSDCERIFQWVKTGKTNEEGTDETDE